LAGFDRYDRVLRLFLEGQNSWTVAEISDALRTSASNIYRTVRELVAAGYLEGAAESHYRLGPVFLEFDHRVRETDPLVRSGGIFLNTLVEQAAVPCSAVLARLYGNKVMCVADARSARFDASTSYQRGRPMPLLRGATSKAILASLPTRKRNRLLQQIADQGGEKEPVGFEWFGAVRKVRFVVTRGEVDAGLLGAAVPVELKGLAMYASLSFILKQSDATEAVLTRLRALLDSYARLIEDFMQGAA
jgi:DNA-binding IclR family transcriptional regulator